MTAPEKSTSTVLSGPELFRVLGDVVTERDAQDRKWGQQDHPDLPPRVSAPVFPEHRSALFCLLGLSTPESYRRDVNDAAADGTSSWAPIALEELAEAIDEARVGDVDALRTELVQLAAVVVQWIQAIDRRPGVPE